jgi:hypothetical protein
MGRAFGDRLRSLNGLSGLSAAVQESRLAHYP